MRKLNLYWTAFALLCTASCLYSQVRITYPNGGEIIHAGDDVSIRWEGVEAEEPVVLQYSTDGGSSWTGISDAASGLHHAWRVPDAASERCLLRVMHGKDARTREIKGYPVDIFNAVFSNDESLILAQGESGVVVVRDAHSEETRWRLDGASIRPNPVYATAVTVSSNTATLRNVATGAVIRTLSEGSGFVRAVRFSPDGSMLVGAYHDGTIMVWNGVTGEYLKTLAGDSGYSQSLLFSANGERLVSIGDEERILKVWDPNSGRLLHIVRGVISAALTPDGRRMVCLNVSDSRARVWDVERGEELFALPGENFIAISPDGTRVIVGPRFRHTVVYDLATGLPADSIEIVRGHYSGALYSPDGERLAIFGRGGIQIRNARTGLLQEHLLGYPDGPISVAFSRDGGRLLSGTKGSIVLLWNLDGLPNNRDLSDAVFTIQSGTMAVGDSQMQPAAGMILHPDPAGGWVDVRVQAGETGEMRLAVIDMLGTVRAGETFQVVRTGEQHARVDVSDLPSGHYIIIAELPSGGRSAAFSIVR